MLCLFRTIPCPAPSRLPPLSKVRCWRPKEFGRLPEGLLFYRTLSVSQTPPLTIPQSQWRKTQFSANASSTFIKSNIENVALHCASSLYTRELKVIVLYQPFQTRTIPCFAPPHLPPLSKVRCCRPIKFGRRPEELQHLLRPFRFSDTSVNNPSVTVTENVILRQHIFYFNIKQYWKTTCFTVPAPFTQGS